MDAGSSRESKEIQRSCSKRREDIEFHGCEQYFGAPKRIRKVEYAFRLGFLALHHDRDY
jgi:hypothetical protein